MSIINLVISGRNMYRTNEKGPDSQALKGIKMVDMVVKFTAMQEYENLITQIPVSISAM